MWALNKKNPWIHDSLVLKPIKKWDLLYFQVLTGTLQDGVSCELRSFLKNVLGTFSKWRIKKAIAIGIIKDDPLVEISWCCFSLHLHVFFPYIAQNRYKELFPNTHFYLSLYSRFCANYGITFNNVNFNFT